MKTIVPLDGHKTFVCSSSLHSSQSQRQLPLDRLSLNEMLTMMDGQRSPFLPFHVKPFVKKKITEADRQEHGSNTLIGE